MPQAGDIGSDLLSVCTENLISSHPVRESANLAVCTENVIRVDEVRESPNLRL